MATIQRNALIAPFSVRDDLMHVNERGKQTGKLATTHQKWFTQAEQSINGSAQVRASVPTSSTSEGQPGEFAFDGFFLYVCVGVNTWLRASLNAF